MTRPTWLILWALATISGNSELRAGDSPWQKGYDVAENSQSPDGRYGVAIPSSDTAGDDEDKVADYVADLKKHRSPTIPKAGITTQVKAEQIAWLKKRDAAGSVTAKCNLLEARIKALQDLLW